MEEIKRSIEARKGAKQSKDAGIVASLYERVNLQREIIALCNQYNEASKQNASRDVLDRIEKQIRRKLEEFYEANGGGHSNPEWIMPTMTACVEYTFKNYQAALDADESALPHAKEKWQRAVSLGNISDSKRLLKRPEEAIKPALQAVELDPNNAGFWFYLILALYGSARFEDLSYILKEIPSMADVSPKSAWKTYIMAHKDTFDEMYDKFEEVGQIYDLFGIKKGGES